MAFKEQDPGFLLSSFRTARMSTDEILIELLLQLQVSAHGICYSEADY